MVPDGHPRRDPQHREHDPRRQMRRPHRQGQRQGERPQEFDAQQQARPQRDLRRRRPAHGSKRPEQIEHAQDARGAQRGRVMAPMLPCRLLHRFDRRLFGRRIVRVVATTAPARQQRDGKRHGRQSRPQTQQIILHRTGIERGRLMVEAQQLHHRMKRRSFVPFDGPVHRRRRSGGAEQEHPPARHTDQHAQRHRLERAKRLGVTRQTGRHQGDHVTVSASERGWSARAKIRSGKLILSEPSWGHAGRPRCLYGDRQGRFAESHGISPVPRVARASPRSRPDGSPVAPGRTTGR